MNEVNGGRHVPRHLWAIGVLALMFTLYGGYDYTMSQLGDREYMAMMTEPYGIDVDVALAYFAGFPVWMHSAWALGVWGGVAGSVLLLARSRWAYPAFLVSLAGLVVSNLYSLTHPVPGLTDTTATWVMTIVIFLVMVALTIYARRMRTVGVLR